MGLELGWRRTRPEYLYECTCIRLFGSAVNCTQPRQRRQSQKRSDREPAYTDRARSLARSFPPPHPPPPTNPPRTARTRASLPCPFRWRMKQFCFLVSIQIRSADIFVRRCAVKSPQGEERREKAGGPER